MKAQESQLGALTRRWQELPGEDVTASFALENLLIAQVTLASAEYEYLQAQLTFKLSIFNLKRATGTLLESEQVAISRTCECCIPKLIADKPAGGDELPFPMEMIYEDELVPVDVQ